MLCDKSILRMGSDAGETLLSDCSLISVITTCPLAILILKNSTQFNLLPIHLIREFLDDALTGIGGVYLFNY